MRVDLLVVEIAQLERADDLPRNDVRRAGKCLNPSDRSDLPARNAADDSIHHLDEPRGAEQRVVPLVHRRRAGVVLEIR